MKKILLCVPLLAIFAAGFFGCSQQRQWNHEQILQDRQQQLQRKQYVLGMQTYLRHRGAGQRVLEPADEEWAEIRPWLRPVLLSIVKSKKVLLEGVTFKNSPSWCLHPLSCEDFTVNNIMVINPWYSQNGDAIDLESCKNALIINSVFDAGDDAICIKSGKDEDGRRRGEPCQNVIVKNNTVLHGHGGFVVGSEMSGGVKNIYVEDCTFMGTDVGLRFKSTRGRGVQYQ